MIHGYEDGRRRVREVHDAMTRRGILEALAADPEDGRVWAQCDLASLLENHLHSLVDPRTLSAAEAAALESRVLREGGRLGPPSGEFARAFWILEGGQRAGSLAIDLTETGGGLLGIASLYVFSEWRRRGVAGRVLGALLAAACEQGLRGLWVPTNWCWQPTVRFYLGLGLWVRSWKHSLVFSMTRDLPPWRVEVEGDAARFLVVRKRGAVPLIRAGRRGDRLRWTTYPALKRGEEIGNAAPGTFALNLAVRGWPIVRSDEMWAQRWNWSDCGQPEGLAAKIEVFEAVARQDGFDVRTPRIPGIPYRDLDAIC
ncbi:MAG: GNAT family N-acetyltransferase [Planctomycetes bacterium]|nr:GNAT family N-acetyltransferase [Planctomycetota bacterium]